MTDREVLYRYRMNQAEETLADAQKMLEENLTPRPTIHAKRFLRAIKEFIPAGQVHIA